MLDDLSEGIFGNIKLGVEKKAKERVVIKIIKKKNAKQSDIGIMRTEIDVMKLCHHPNVANLKQKYKVEEKRKSVYKSNCERNKIVEVDE